MTSWTPCTLVKMIWSLVNKDTTVDLWSGVNARGDKNWSDAVKVGPEHSLKIHDVARKMVGRLLVMGPNKVEWVLRFVVSSPEKVDLMVMHASVAHYEMHPEIQNMLNWSENILKLPDNFNMNQVGGQKYLLRKLKHKWNGYWS